MSRNLIIVDCESSGLRDVDIAVEVAWHNLDTGETGSFVPEHSVSWVLEHGEDRALEINGYRERLADAAQDDGREVERLWMELAGNTLAGANPRIDAAWLGKLFDDYDQDPEPWHHRLVDVSNQAAALLGIDPRRLPGLWDVCRMLDVGPGDHTAAEDVRATVECFARLDFLQRHPVELRDLRAALPGVDEFAAYFGEVAG